MNGRIIILAGGMSSRMKKSDESLVRFLDKKYLTEAESKPKSMIGFGKESRPFIDYLLANIRKAGYGDVVILVNERDEFIRNYYHLNDGAIEFGSLRLSCAVQRIPEGRSKPMGTADALLTAMNNRPDWVGGKFTVCNSDNLYSVKALALLLNSAHPNSMIDYNVEGLRFPKERLSDFAVTKKNRNGFLSDILEKPSAADLNEIKSESSFVGVSMNLWRFDFEMFLPYLREVEINPARNEKEIPTAVKNMISDQPNSLFAHPLNEHVIDLTSKSDINEVGQYLERNFKTD